MARRPLPALLVAATALADASGRHDLALYALLLAVPGAAAAGLAVYGELLDGSAEPSRQLQVFLWPVALLLILGGTAVRAPAIHDDAVPPLATSALVGVLAVLALETLVGAGRVAVERRTRPRGLAVEPE
jgi:hypothetical protein